MERVVLQSPQGELQTVDASEADRALQEGGYTRPETPQSAESPYNTPTEKAKTFLEGAASAGTFGLSTALETGLQPPGSEPVSDQAFESQTGIKNIFAKPKDVVGRRAENPGYHLAGELTSLVGQSLVGTGEAALLENAGTSAAKALGLEGTSLASRLGAAGVRGAVENAIFQEGDENSKLISDPDASFQTALAHVGLAATLGGATSAGFAAVSPLWKAAAGQKVGQFIEDFKGRIQEHLNNPDPLSLLSEELSNRLTSSDAVFDEVYGPKGIKSEAISKLMPNQMSDTMIGQAEDTVQASRHFLDEMNRNTDLFPRNLSARFERDFNILKDSLAEPKDPSQVFNSLQEFKQRLQAYLPKKGQFLTTVDPAYEFINGVRSLASELRTGLEDPEIWGKAGDVQQEINKAFSEYMTPRKQFEGKFTTKVGDDKIIDPGKLQTYLNQTGKAGQKIKQEMLGNFLQADTKYREAINKTFEKLGQESPFPPSPTGFTESTLKDLSPGAKLADAFVKKGLSKLVGKSAGAVIGGAVGSIFGSPGFGALIGEHALGPFLDSTLPALVKPMLSLKTSAEGFKSAIDYAANVIRGENLLTKSTKAIFDSSREVLPQTLISTDKLEKRLDHTDKDPELLFNIGGQTGHYLPDHAASMALTTANAVNYLKSLKPSTMKKLPLDPEPQPSKMQIHQYKAALEIAEQPLVVLQQLKEGRLSSRSLEALQNLYPSLYQRMRDRVQDQMIESVHKGQNIPYQTRMGLSLFLGTPLDSTMTSQAILATQPQPTQPPMPQQKPKHSMTALNKMPGMDQTPSQSREQHRIQK